MESGREIVTDKVENALLKRALGYEAEDSQVISHVKEDGSVTIAEIRKQTRHIPPETAAMAFYLKNRRPDLWKDRHDVKTFGNVIIKLNDDEMKL